MLASLAALQWIGRLVCLFLAPCVLAVGGPVLPDLLLLCLPGQERILPAMVRAGIVTIRTAVAGTLAAFEDGFCHRSALQPTQQIADGRPGPPQIVGAVPVPEAEDCICRADGLDTILGFGSLFQDTVNTIRCRHAPRTRLRRWFCHGMSVCYPPPIFPQRLPPAPVHSAALPPAAAVLYPSASGGDVRWPRPLPSCPSPLRSGHQFYRPAITADQVLYPSWAFFLPACYPSLSFFPYSPDRPGMVCCDPPAGCSRRSLCFFRSRCRDCNKDRGDLLSSLHPSCPGGAGPT